MAVSASKSAKQNTIDKRRQRTKWMEPMGSIPRSPYLAISILSFVVLLCLWSFITPVGLVSALFLPTPVAVLRTGVTLFTQFGFIHDIGATVYRVFAGFFIAAIIAVPLGLLMGTFKVIEAFVEPMNSF